MLLPRILTALIGIPVVIAAIHFGGIVYMTFVGCVILLCLYEYGLALTAGKKPVHLVSLMLFGLLMAVVAILGRATMPGLELPDNLYPFTISVVIFGVLLFEVLTPKRSWERVCNTFTGIFLIPWALAHMINIRDIATYGEYLTLFMIITVWVSDTGAYFSGRFFGKHKLNKEVSPKKTWEGAIGGTLLAVGGAVLMRNLFLSTLFSVQEAIWMGLLVAVVGQVSDLAESVLKRSCGVKDSSNLLPGHGGFLDRFDSYLLLAPLFYYVVLYTL
ncbi:MAG: phosphatidate cytidylyltransferase [Elusimicrobium sp.]|uniref:Phosphatidate cytidylyltransferase n=1 Tax=Candidatus Avelusimicrobium gallicola TaxID=2562704 RepID=A0A928DQJ1_9BACT|nr:phosphatidate cytidylyltransferase [Elusimicrobium sp.]